MDADAAGDDHWALIPALLRKLAGRRTMNDAATIALADVVHQSRSPPRSPKVQSHRRRYLLAGIVLLLVAGAGAAWWWTAGRSAAIRYTTAPATSGTVARAVTA